jgi:hypothetical protein
MAEEKAKPMSNQSLVQSQAEYKGNSHFDRVDIEIIKDGDYYKSGDKDSVHPSLAAILKSKGLIKDFDVNKNNKSAAAVQE